MSVQGDQLQNARKCGKSLSTHLWVLLPNTPSPLSHDWKQLCSLPGIIIWELSDTISYDHVSVLKKAMKAEFYRGLIGGKEENYMRKVYIRISIYFTAVFGDNIKYWIHWQNVLFNTETLRQAICCIMHVMVFMESNILMIIFIAGVNDGANYQ